MHILVLSTGLFYRRYGQQRYELNFLSSCFSQGSNYSFRVILLNDFNLPNPWPAQAPRIKLSPCGGKIRFFSKIKFVFLSFWYVLKKRPNFLICGHINLSFLTLLIARLLRLKYIILTHGTDVWHIKSKLKITALESALKIITVSRYTEFKLIQQIPVLESKIIILPNSVDTDVFFPAKRSESLLRKHNLSGFKILLTVARLDTADKDKGYDKIFAALPRVTRIKKQVNKLGIDRYVQLCGYVTDSEIVGYYNLCDCYVMPSVQEGFGIVFLEAIACGKPVIAGNRDGSQDALLDGKAGILVNPDDVNKIAETIINVLQGKVSEDLLDANHLRQIAVEHFSLKKFTQNAKQIFSEVVRQQ